MQGVKRGAKESEHSRQRSRKEQQTQAALPRLGEASTLSNESKLSAGVGRRQRQRNRNVCRMLKLKACETNFFCFLYEPHKLCCAGRGSDGNSDSAAAK